MPCTVSVDTNLFPVGVTADLDARQLAETAGIKSCFLRNQAGMSVHAAAVFAKQLYAAGVFTVGDFLLRLTHEGAQTMPPACVSILVKCLQRFPGLPEIWRAARGTVVPTWLLRVVGAAALAHPTGVVWFCCAFRGRLHGCSVMHRASCNL